MSIQNEGDLQGMKKVSRVVAQTLKKMCAHARPGMTTRDLDAYGAALLAGFGARSAPMLTYDFPGFTCISVNHEFCHGIPSDKVLREGDLVNIDVSAELQGYWSDNGCSFVLGEDHRNFQPLIDASREILKLAVNQIRGGVGISDVGHLIHLEAKKRGYKVVRNLAGHGVGRSLHEDPGEITNYRDPHNTQKFESNTVVAVETFITTRSNYARVLSDGWTMVGNRGGYMAQHEHSILVTEGAPVVLTEENNFWN